MHPRRDFAAGCAAAFLTPLVGCGDATGDDYAVANRRQRSPPAGEDDLAGFVRFATLAASGHNTQPWRFETNATAATIIADPSRRTPVVDPDDHHLFVGLGCAAENFLLAASGHGRPGALAVSDGRISIGLGHGPARPDALYRAIPERQSTRSDYDGRAVSNAELKALEGAAAEASVSVILITDQARREGLLDLVIEATTRQMDDLAFVRELKDWLRFNPAEALLTGDGLFSRCSGGPTLPTWVGKPLFGLFFNKAAESAKYQSQIRSSAGIAVFVGERADEEHWIRVGRSFQRFALQATALGIRHAMINQPVEVAPVRAEFARWLGAPDARPDLVVRFGRAPPMPLSMRRPLDAVLTNMAP